MASRSRATWRRRGAVVQCTDRSTVPVYSTVSSVRGIGLLGQMGLSQLHVGAATQTLPDPHDVLRCAWLRRRRESTRVRAPCRTLLESNSAAHSTKLSPAVCRAISPVASIVAAWYLTLSSSSLTAGVCRSPAWRSRPPHLPSLGMKIAMSRHDEVALWALLRVLSLPGYRQMGAFCHPT